MAATSERTPHKDETSAPAQPPATQPPAASSPAPPQESDWRARRDARMKEEAERYKAQDDILYNQATGVMTDEKREQLLALGEDITRASPVVEQNLPDPTPGLTTTTGAHRTPIDPTTAAVPASPDSEIVMRMRGTPTIGSGREGGKPEVLFKSREGSPTPQSTPK